MEVVQAYNFSTGKVEGAGAFRSSKPEAKATSDSVLNRNWKGSPLICSMRLKLRVSHMLVRALTQDPPVFCLFVYLCCVFSLTKIARTGFEFTILLPQFSTGLTGMNHHT